jgi:hypothetical protein
VHANGPATRDVISARLRNELEKRGITIYLYHVLFPPPRDWSEEDRWAVYDSLSIEAELAVGVGESRDVTSIANGRTAPSVTALPTRSNEPSRNYGHPIGGYPGTFNTSTGARTQTTTSYSVALFDLAQDRAAW